MLLRDCVSATRKHTGALLFWGMCCNNVDVMCPHSQLQHQPVVFSTETVSHHEMTCSAYLLEYQLVYIWTS